MDAFKIWLIRQLIGSDMVITNAHIRMEPPCSPGCKGVLRITPLIEAQE